MYIAEDQIRANLESVKQRISDAAQRVGRSPETVRLIAVTKTVGPEELRVLYKLGQHDFGENRIENARPKIESITQPAYWHMIGSVQRRKARDVVELFDSVDSVDRIELAETLEQRCKELGKHMDILIEVNVSGEAAKHGFSPDQLPMVLDQINNCAYLSVKGLMTMAPFVDNPEEVRPIFAHLRNLAEQFSLMELSMGMTNDFEVAIEEGATQVRIGSALFE